MPSALVLFSRYMDEISDALRREPECRDDDATTTATADDDAAVPRHLYTLTVEKVGALLNAHGVDRDVRTIQRWCKGGKIKAIIDPVNADRYLIEPSSVDDMIATLLTEKQRQDVLSRSVSRQSDDAVATPADRVAGAGETPRDHRVDTGDNVAAASSDVATTPEERRDNDATGELSRLRSENALLRADVRAREQMIEYMTGQFEKTMDIALERSTDLGTMAERARTLEVENAKLTAQLPAPDDAPAQAPISFHPHSIGQEAAGDNSDSE